MNNIEFNAKYAKYLEPRHYGLAINIPEIVEYLDFRFQHFIKDPEFRYSQIKVKFGYIRVYSTLSSELCTELEEDCQLILNSIREK